MKQDTEINTVSSNTANTIHTHSNNCANCRRYVVDGSNIIKPIIKRNSRVLLLGAEPTTDDLRYKTPFSNKVGLIIKKLLYKVSIDLGLPDNTFSYMNTVLCASNSEKLDASTINCCNGQLLHNISLAKPEYIIAFGIEAVKALGINTSKLANVRGVFVDLPSNTNIKVLPTFGFSVIESVSGKLPILEQDLIKVCSQIIDDNKSELDNMEPKGIYHTKYDDIVKTLQSALEYIDLKYSKTNKKVLVALDTETHRSQISRDDSKIIAISMCWDAEFGGYSYPYRHKENPFTEDELNNIRELTNKIICNDKVSLTLANTKYDYGFLVKEGLGSILPDWDILLGEHCLEEDKAGEYSLKVLTTDYFPSIGKYANELGAEQADIQRKLDAECSEAINAYHIGFGYVTAKELLSTDLDVLREAVEALDINAPSKTRVVKGALALYRELINGEVTGLDTSITESNDVVIKLTDGKKVKQTKTAIALATIVLIGVSADVKDLRAITTPFYDYHRTLEKAIADIKDRYAFSFEMYKLNTLLKYAATDAYTTYLITLKQVERFKVDTTKVDNILKKEAVSMHIPSLFNVMFKHSMPLIRAISCIEYGGVKLDTEYILSKLPDLSNEADNLLKGIINKVGYNININSVPQLSDLLYNKLGLPIESVTKKGAPSVDEETLIKLADRYDVTVLKDIITLRKIKKVTDTYWSNWLNLSKHDGKLHASFNIIGTATGRLSCSEPRLGRQLVMAV